ncbi:hypothetical protein HBHAL_1841 [Halobacillus halophilus DSM 2266]|uniref:Uncharacterized protein n=1 Tax=Halobacillus halophilus (strain ATCC 35676 / DSM 2266 / JCM 20832 / KCTC 3685 / LMG 17431 / NBRC 102448 / NCIMB 2269) TaxID=866895 RepID=I0JJ87_HALH3|nr:hypothetical protein [Halobacillus halophilus]CCG44205.1 hypothetical protein HBHAL_1841 [Halobacillus halophilus DSM 2266]
MVVLKLVDAGQGTSTFERPVHTTLTKVLPLLTPGSLVVSFATLTISSERTIL